MEPAEGRRLHVGTLDFAEGWRSRLQQAADLRRRITAATVVTIRDIEHKARLLAEAQELAGTLAVVADAVTATGLAAAKLHGKKCDAAFLELVDQGRERGGRTQPGCESWAHDALQAGRPSGNR